LNMSISLSIKKKRYIFMIVASVHAFILYCMLSVDSNPSPPLGTIYTKRELLMKLDELGKASWAGLDAVLQKAVQSQTLDNGFV
jgi:hypothetical protein